MLSPNAGTEQYLLEKHTGIIHYLKHETENCKILEAGAKRCCITYTYHEAENIAFVKYMKNPVPCKYCCIKQSH